MADGRTNVLQHCQVSPSPGAVAEKTLPLTFFDLLWLIHPPISRVLFYDFPCSTSYFTTTLVPNLKNSLSMALEHFFPLAGNLITPTNISIINPQIRYLDGDSVSLTFAECTGKDFNHVSGNHARDAEELTPLVPQLPSGGTENNISPSSGGLVLVSPVLAVQITLFPNQGISVGFTNSHAVADGSSMFNFIRAWASFALQLRSGSSRDDNRDDAPLLLIHHQLPFYDRSVIKDPKQLATLFRSQLAEIENDKSSQPQNAPPSPTINKVRATFIMRRSDIQKLKNLVSAQRPNLAHVSSFMAVCAYLWTCIAKARVVEDHVADDQSELFGIAMDCRARLDPPVPETYFGNCISGCFASRKSSELVKKREGFVIAAELIGECIHTQIHNEEGGVLKNLELCIPLLMDVLKKSVRTLGVAGSPNFDYYNTVDFGWGKPKKFEFFSEPLSISRCKDSQGDLEIGLCLPKNEMDAFSEIFAQGIGGLCTYAISVGLNVVREICLRMPLLMTEDLLQDLVLYKKSNEKSVSSAARSLISLFRQVCPSLLIKKDRGRPTNPKARPKAFGEVNVASNVPGVELLQEDEEDDDNVSDDADEIKFGSSSDNDLQDDAEVGTTEEDAYSDIDSSGDGDAFEYESGSSSGADDEDQNEEDNCVIGDLDLETESEHHMQDDDELSDDEDASNFSDNEGDTSEEDDSDEEVKLESNRSHKTSGRRAPENDGVKGSEAKKRKFSDFDGQLNAANRSLRALKRLAGSKVEHTSSELDDCILSNEDFQRIKELKAKKEARIAMTQHGLLRKGSDAKSAPFKIPTSDQLSVKRMDAAKLEVNLRRKLSKEERLALIKERREERGKYQARAATKQKKTGGLSNRQKEHKKAMPIAAKRAKVAKSRLDKKKKQQRSGKQFRGRKAWK